VSLLNRVVIGVLGGDLRKKSVRLAIDRAAESRMACEAVEGWRCSYPLVAAHGILRGIRDERDRENIDCW
jgi:hypothetical protein